MADTGDGSGGVQGEGGRRSGRKTAVGDDVGTPGGVASRGREDTAVGDEAALGDDGAASHRRRSMLDEGAGDDGVARARARRAARGRRVGRVGDGRDDAGGTRAALLRRRWK